MGGTKIKFVPFKEPNGADFNAPYALRGYVEVLHPAGASEATIGEILDHLAQIGIDTAPATDAYAEQLYLRKGMQIRTDVFTDAKLNAADAILADTAKNDLEKVTALKAMAEKELGIKLPDRITPDYDPRGHANAFDQGWVRTERWDLPRSNREGDERLQACTTPRWPSRTRGFDSKRRWRFHLHHGAAAQRHRNQTGMSPQADLDTGGQTICSRASGRSRKPMLESTSKSACFHASRI